MSAKAVNQALARLRATLPRSGADTGPDPVEDLITLINAAVENHVHEHGFDPVRVGRAILVSGSHGEALEADPGPGAPDEAPEPTESRRRPGKPVPTRRQVLDRVQDALVEVGMHGYAPLSVDEGVKALARVLQMTREQLAVAQASARQHLEASSHRAQIAEHYRAALQRIADDGPPEWRAAARGALQAPEWDGRIRP